MPAAGHLEQKVWPFQGAFFWRLFGAFLAPFSVRCLLSRFGALVELLSDSLYDPLYYHVLVGTGRGLPSSGLSLGIEALS